VAGGVGTGIAVGGFGVMVADLGVDVGDGKKVGVIVAGALVFVALGTMVAGRFVAVLDGIGVTVQVSVRLGGRDKRIGCSWLDCGCSRWSVGWQECSRDSWRASHDNGGYRGGCSNRQSGSVALKDC
jgi:hypothetical protein